MLCEAARCAAFHMPLLHAIGKASDAVQAEIGGAEPGSYYSGLAYRTGIIRTGLGAILFGAFAQPKLDNM